MNKWLSLWSVRQPITNKTMKKIKKAGFQGVEIWAEHNNAKETFEFARVNDLEISLHLPFHDLNFATRFEEIADFAIQVNKNWLKLLHEYNGSHAVIHGGLAIESVNYEQALSNLVERLKHLNNYAEELNVDILFENQIPDKLKYTHIFPSSVDEWIDILNNTKTKACLDIGHLSVEGSEFEETVDRLGSSLKSIHLSDNDSKSDLHLLPGDGSNNIKANLKYLKKIDFKNPIVFEINPYGYTLDELLNHKSIKNFEKI